MQEKSLRIMRDDKQTGMRQDRQRRESNRIERLGRVETEKGEDDEW